MGEQGARPGRSSQPAWDDPTAQQGVTLRISWNPKPMALGLLQRMPTAGL